jgi:enediyne biosynthesis protein E4
MECVPELDKGVLNYRYRQPRLLYWNVGGGRFKDWSASPGAGITEPWVSRGSAVGDLDKDGSLEVVINHLDNQRSLPKNFVTKKNWLLIQCVGTTANRDGDRDKRVRLCE